MEEAVKIIMVVAGSDHLLNEIDVTRHPNETAESIAGAVCGALLQSGFNIKYERELKYR